MTNKQIAGVLFVVAAVLFLVAAFDSPAQGRVFAVAAAFAAAGLAVQVLA
jgi:hypothetical protein